QKVLGYGPGQTPQYGKIRDPDLDEGDFVFILRAAAPVVARTEPRADRQRKAAPRFDEEEELWEEIKNSKDPEDFKDYLEAYPTGRFKVTARIKKRKLERRLKKAAVAKTAAVRPPAPAKEGPPSGVTWELRFWGGEGTAHAAVPVPGGGYIISYSTKTQMNGERYTSLLRVKKGGERVWTQIIGREGKKVSGSLIALSKGGFVFAGNAKTMNSKNERPFVLKLDKKGRRVWERVLDFAGRNISISSFVQNRNRGFLVAGSETHPGSNVFVSGLDKEGSNLWVKNFGGSRDYKLFSIGITQEKESFRVGNIIYRGTGIFVAGHTNSMRPEMLDAWLIRLNGNGGKFWERIYGGKKVDAAQAVKTLPDGGVVFAGLTNSKGAGGADAWMVRTSKKGKLMWERTYGGKDFDKANAVALVPGGGFILAGETRSKGAGKTDGWLIRLDQNGNKIWDRTYGGKNHDRFFSVRTTPDWGFIVSGNRDRTGKDGNKGGKPWVIKMDLHGRYKESFR
ncbi:MAG: hypothetical protein IID17_14325, partial [Nitrospinae bacterium]|nr:hypothetical protein [Nitrospinota bacterium]